MSPRSRSEAPRLVVPGDLHVEPVAVARLHRALRRAPAGVAGVVALVDAPPAGSSATVHAERCAARHSDGEGDGADRIAPGAQVRGVALVRTEAAVAAVGPDHLTAGAPLTVDRGAVAHDPWHLPPREVASPLARPAYPRRPVVLFLACEPDVAAADTARALANGLLRREVEARLAVPEVPSGLHLSVPCAPERASVDALRPEVVVALDERALEAAERWCADLPTTTLVEMTVEITDQIERIGGTLDDDGRRRARIGRLCPIDALAALVARLVSGPQPGAPVVATPTARETAGEIAREIARENDGEPPAVAVAAPTRRTPALPPTAPAVAVVGTSPADATHWLGEVLGAPTDGGDPERANLVLVAADRPTAGRELAAARARGAHTLAVRDPATSRAAPAALAALARTATGVVVPSAADAAALGDEVAVLVARPGLPGSLVDRLLAAPVAGVRGTLGWWLGPVVPRVVPRGGAGAPPRAATVAAALRGLLDRHPDAAIEVLDTAEALPTDLRRHPRLHTITVPARGPLPTDRIAAWSAAVWTPGTGAGPAEGEVRPLLVVQATGTPVVVAATDAAALGGLCEPAQVVTDEADQAAWLERLSADLERAAARPGVEEPARAAVSALAGPAARAAVAARLWGWLAAIAPSGAGR